MLIASLILNAVFAILIVLSGIILRGIMKNNSATIENYKRHDLTGRERETIRRKIIASGLTTVHPHEILDLIYTFRSIEVGDYHDNDPYVPVDTYEDLDNERPS